jgi:hypothetical protein
MADLLLTFHIGSYRAAINPKPGNLRTGLAILGYNIPSDVQDFSALLLSRIIILPGPNKSLVKMTWTLLDFRVNNVSVHRSQYTPSHRGPGYFSFDYQTFFLGRFIRPSGPFSQDHLGPFGSH